MLPNRKIYTEDIWKKQGSLFGYKIPIAYNY